MSRISVLLLWGFPVLNILSTREIKKGSALKYVLWHLLIR